MDAGRRDITMIFNKARTLEVPFFQRSYVWEKENWERFADDLIDVGMDPRGYFLGSIILKQKDTSAGKAIGDVRVVVDGQQRLTSLVLFFRVMCDGRERTDLFDKVFINLADDLILKHNQNDIEVFAAIAREGKVPSDLRERYRENRVLRAFDYFESRRDELVVIDPIVLIQHLYVVGIDLGKDEDEQQIFDTINSLGVDLTTAELLKNRLFDRSDVELFDATWRPAFEASEDRRQYWSQLVTAGRAHRQNIDLFLQAFLLNQPNVTDDVRVGTLFHDYTKYLDEHVLAHTAFIREITTAADTYRRSVDPSLLDQAIDGSDACERLNLVVFGLQTTTVLPYFLYLLRDVEDRDERDAMLRLVETYLLRRLVSGATTKHYNRFFAGLAHNGVRKYADLVERLTRSDDPSTSLPSNDDVAEGFQATNLTNQQARIVLYLIELSIRDETHYSTSLAGYSHYTLEHIMPKKWQNRWPSVSEEQVETRNKLLLKLGNLTLLSAQLNRSIRDADWKTKKVGSGDRGGLLRYGVGLEIFQQDLAEDDWTEEHIRARGIRLAERAVSADVWPYPSRDS